jgi:hypothetical protein
VLKSGIQYWMRSRSRTCWAAISRQIERGLSFAVVHVSDVSQTAPLPGYPHSWQPPVRHAATGDDATAWAVWDAMLSHAAALALTVSTSEGDPLARSGVFGYEHHEARAIWVRPLDLALRSTHYVAAWLDDADACRSLSCAARWRGWSTPRWRRRSPPSSAN